MRQKEEDGILKSRAFALFLIGVASLYVFVMICQAYKTNRVQLHNFSSEYESEYTYAT